MLTPHAYGIPSIRSNRIVWGEFERGKITEFFFCVRVNRSALARAFILKYNESVGFVFNELKSVQAAAYLLKKAKGQMNYLLLIKLLYEADRNCLCERGFPITGDKPFSMKNGPALSKIVDFLSQKRQELPNSVWHMFIPRPAKLCWECKLETDPGDDWLSQTDRQFLDAAFAKYGGMKEFTVSKLMHEYPEFKEPGDSSVPISFEEIMRANNVPEEVISEAAEDADAVAELKAN